MSLNSMTGYASTTFALGGANYLLELKVVNHRYLEVRSKVPRNFNPVENGLSSMVKARFERGRFELTISNRDGSGTSSDVTVNEPLARAYFKALERLRVLLASDEQVSLSLLARSPDVIARGTAEVTPEAIEAALVAPVSEVLAGVAQMRAAEGANLEVALREQLAGLLAQAETARTRAPEVIAAAEQRLRERIEKALATVGGHDESRLLQEVAILSERLDVSEELVRLASHADQFSAALAAPGPHGKKLDFLLQEMNREANTIASKSNDITLTQAAVEMKLVVEKCREQVQNVE